MRKRLTGTMVLAAGVLFGIANAAHASAVLTMTSPMEGLTDTFKAEPGGGITPGIGGYVEGSLFLSDASGVYFEYLGFGNSTNFNTFTVGNTTIFCTQNNTGGLCGGTATPIGTTVKIDLPAGEIAVNWEFDLASDGTGGHTLQSDQVINPTSNNGAYLAQIGSGADPSTGPGQIAFLGLSDNPYPADNDFQDLGVQVTVPEPGSIALVGIGLLGLGLRWRKRSC